MNWRQIIPTIVTLCALLAGFLSILVLFIGVQSETPGVYHQWSALLIMLAMILDGLDGNIARALKGATDFGAELDTYVDLIAFGIAPAILIFAVTLQGHSDILRVVLPAAVAVSGVVRLARFKVKDPLRGQGGYAGLPITANAGWVALLVFISQSPPTERFSLNSGPMAIVFLCGIVLFTLLQVTSLRYPKPTKKAYLFIPIVVLVAIMFLRGTYQIWAIYSAAIILLLGVGYIFIGPLFVKGHTAWASRRERKNNEHSLDL